MDIASYIDHTLLKPTATQGEIQQLCAEAVQHGFAAVCVPPYFVSQAAAYLADSKVKVATVTGFPFGYSAIGAKLAEVQQALSDGADEIDIVINLAALKEGAWDYLSWEITTLLQPVRLHRKVIKLIIESGVLTEQEILQCCALYARHKVDFLKTSTGYAEKGAELATVKLMRDNLPPDILIKASGGIRTFAFAKELVAAGAARIGASAGVRIVEEADKPVGIS